jgi:hypothetical protein
MKDLLQILQTIRDTHGAGVFADAGQLRALLADYAAGRYKGERQIFLMAMGDGLVARLRRESDVIESFLRTQASYFATTYFLGEETAQGVVWCWAEILGLRVNGKAVLLRDAPGVGGTAVTTTAFASAALVKSGNRTAAWVFWAGGLLFIIGIAVAIVNSQHQQELAAEQARQQQLAEDQIRQQQLALAEEQERKRQSMVEEVKRQQQLVEEQIRQQQLAEELAKEQAHLEQMRQQQLAEEQERKRKQRMVEEVKALFNKGFALEVQGKFVEAIAVYDEIDRRFGKDDTPVVREQVASDLKILG